MVDRPDPNYAPCHQLFLYGVNYSWPATTSSTIFPRVLIREMAQYDIADNISKLIAFGSPRSVSPSGQLLFYSINDSVLRKKRYRV
jgi:hypothetical protein